MVPRPLRFTLFPYTTLFRSEIESAVVAHPAVSEAAAIGVPHEVKGEVIWVFCVPTPGADTPDTDELRGLVAAELGKAFSDRKSTRLNSSHMSSRMPSSA